MSEGQAINVHKKQPHCISTKIFRIGPHDLLKIRVHARDVVTPNERALVCQIEFFDNQGVRLERGVKGASVSERYGDYIYIRSVSEGELVFWEVELIHAPDNAETLHLTLYPWKVSSELKIEGDIECVDYRTIATDSLTTTFSAEEGYTAEFSISHFWRSAYSLEMLKKSDLNAQNLDVHISFVDCEGNALDLDLSSTQPMLGQVQLLEKSVLMVVPVVTLSEYEGFTRLQADIHLLAPRHAVKLCVLVRGASVSKILLTQKIWAFEALLESRLTVESTAVIAQFAGIPLEMGIYVFTRLMDKFPEAPSVYAAALDYFFRHNQISETKNVANQILNRFHNADMLRKAKKTLSLVVSLSPQWLPSTGKSDEFSTAKRWGQGHLKAAHLLRLDSSEQRTEDIDITRLLAFQNQLEKVNPFIITPAKNEMCNDQGTVWDFSEKDQIRRYDLNCISYSDAETIPVTTLLSFTAVVAKQIVMMESADIIHSHEGYQGYNFALIGLALSQALHIPFVYESGRASFGASGEVDIAAGAFSEARQQQEYRCMREAHAVILPANTKIEDFEEHGIERKKIFFLAAESSVKAESESEQDPLLSAANEIYLKAYQHARFALHQ